jgi:hypothetical protein
LLKKQPCLFNISSSNPGLRWNKALAVDESAEGRELDQAVTCLAIVGNPPFFLMAVVLQQRGEERNLNIQPAFTRQHCLNPAPQSAWTDSYWNSCGWSLCVRRLDNLKNAMILVYPVVMLSPITYVRIANNVTQERYGHI